MSTNKQIQAIQKQNNSIYMCLTARNIVFERIIINENMDEFEQIKLLNEENIRLKEVVKANKPIQQLKEEEKKIENIAINKNENENENKDYEEPIIKFDTITNMENIKRAFFNGEYELFEKQIKLNPFKFYIVDYKYNSDKNNAPDFSAINLLKGFIRNFDNYRKYFMICFRCYQYQNKNEYKYKSLWIVNTNEPIKNIIGSIWDDFIFEETFDSDNFIKMIKKLPQTMEKENNDIFTCIGEVYVH